MSVDEILAEIGKYGCNLVEITGGEPLVQEESLDLMHKLCEAGYEVLLETGGSLSIKEIDRRVNIILDLKCPSSGMEKKNLYENLDYIKSSDEVKFVIGNREDYEWTKQKLNEYDLTNEAKILCSVVFGKLEPLTLVKWILEDRLKVRFQLQMHKFIWKPEERGV